MIDEKALEVKESLAEVAVFRALDKTLHYTIPEKLDGQAMVGCRVLVPLGRREAVGVIVSRDESLPDGSGKFILRPVKAVLDRAPTVPPEQIVLCQWISRYYFYPLGEVLRNTLPSGMEKYILTFTRLTAAGLERFAVTQPTPLLKLLHEMPQISLRDIRRKRRTLGDWEGELKSLEAEGLIERTFEWIPPTAAQGKRKRRNIQAPEAAEAPENIALHTLFPDQVSVVNALLPHVRSPRFRPFLLFGVTGSGKTEIYIRLVEEAVKGERGALVLVPEIALSSQLESLFRQRFGNLMAVWHSRLSAADRLTQWMQLQKGEKRVLLGVRSAIFMPVSHLGLIIVDEEHDSSYKQEDTLRYHARDVAVMRASLIGAPVVLGSATPSLQSLFHCRTGRYTCLTLPNRVFDRPLPELRLIDMRRQSGRNRILSRELRQALSETMEEGKQALLFLNRRGFATFTLCNACGNVVQCAHCSVSLTYHQSLGKLCCHYCGWMCPLPETCPLCGRTSIFTHGFGTERVEDEVRQFLPGIPIVRLDRDTAGQPRRMSEVLSAMRRRKAKILIGTQMIAKGHHFPDVTLVGVVNGDTSLQIADFRAGETTVQLLMQVAGRAGRGDRPGRVLLQTYNPGHYTLEAVLKMDYMSFVEKELESRERLQYPPFARLLKFLVTSPHEEMVKRAAWQLAGLSREIAEELRNLGQHTAVLGPSPAPLSKLKNRFRWHVFVKAWNNRDLQELTERVYSRKNELSPLNRVQVAVDRDPVMSL